MTANQSIFVLFLLAGVVLLLLGLYLYFQQRARLKRWLKAQGSIIELLRTRKSGEVVLKKTESGRKLQPKYLYRPVVRFQTQAKETVEFSPSVLTRPAQVHVGTQLEVLYDPENPHQALINRFVYLWFSVLILLFFGLFFTGMGLLGILIQL